MITYAEIGHFGRLGNQMFQFASTIGIAKKLGYDVSFPLENTENPSVEHFKDGVTRSIYFDIPKIFKIPSEIIKKLEEIEYDKVVQEPHFHFYENIFSIMDGTSLRGYFQSEKYFEHCKNYIRDVFSFKDHIVKRSNDLFPKVDVDTVSVHFRMGDYVGLQEFHPICDSEYYQSAMSFFMDKNYYFLIFSDNIEYCKQLFGESKNIMYVSDNDPQTDMCLMSMCDHNVIANSSFSWWGAWLNDHKNKKVIAPKKWFGSAYDHTHNTKDLYCQNWIVI